MRSCELRCYNLRRIYAGKISSVPPAERRSVRPPQGSLEAMNLFPDHPLLKKPSPRAALWRYMSVPKFLSLLSRRALYFPTLEALGDDYEGRYSDATLARFPNLRDFEPHSRALAVNCWSLAPADSPVHWSTFCPGDFGVAVVSSLERLSSAFDPRRAIVEPTLFAARVRYVDFARHLHVKPDSAVNALITVATKRIQFRAESEVRLILFGDPRLEAGSDNNRGVHLSLNLAKALDAVVCGPGSPSWFQEDIGKLLKRYRLSSVSVKRSHVDAKRSMGGSHITLL